MNGLQNGLYNGLNNGLQNGLYLGNNNGLQNGLFDNQLINKGIVYDGLILYLDASNRTSYIGNGTDWKDLTANKINGTLVGPTFNIDKQGCFIFDGINDYITTSANSILNFCTSTNDLPFTVSVWFNINSLSTIFNLFNKGDNGDGALESYYGFINTSGNANIRLFDTTGSNQYTVTSNLNLTTNKWYNVTFTYSGQGAQNRNVNIYINGIIQNKTISTLGTYTRMRVQNTSLFLGSLGSTGVYKEIQSNGKYSSYFFYNKELTISQILQNYNATRTRFGI